ncbi:hypothetical protein RYA05_03115 [Pseudomonas syringae pv. actinidiae]|nr:hypothetical protein [Pseudomonas syringae pv. actinidiae]
MKRVVHFKPLCSEHACGWLVRLKALNAGYSASSRSMAFGRMSHVISLAGVKVILKQGASQGCKTELDDVRPEQLEILRDLSAIGVLTGLPQSDLVALAVK